MALIQEFVQVNSEYVRLENTINHLQIQLAQNQEYKQQYEQQIENLYEELDTLKSFNKTRVPLVIKQAVTQFEQARSQELGNIKFRKNNIETAIRNIYPDLARQEERLSNITNVEILYTKEMVKEQLESNDKIVNKSICLGEDSHGHFIRWRYENIVMKPDINPFINVNFGGEVAINLPPAIVQIYPGDNSVKIMPMRNRPRHTGFAHNVCHPHVLGNNNPCLGDYAGPVVEAISEGHLETVASLLELFLSGAADSDAAGKHWYRWLFDDDTLDSTYREYDGKWKLVSFAVDDNGARQLQYFVQEDGQTNVYVFKSKEELDAKKEAYHANR